MESLDEAVLIWRKSTGLRLDPQIPGFHMYGADICQEAKRLQMKCYAIAAFCIHNTNQYAMFPWQFWWGYLRMRRKWKAQLPIRTTCTEITHWCWPMIRWNVVQAANIMLGRHQAFKRLTDPARLYRELVARGLVNPAESKLTKNR